MRVLFPSEPFDDRVVDACFEDELRAARRAGYDIYLLAADALQERRFDRAIHRIPSSVADDQVLYRGWMLSVKSYAGLYDALKRRGIRLINRPEQYEHVHHLPASYEIIKDHTARTVWSKSADSWDPKQ